MKNSSVFFLCIVTLFSCQNGDFPQIGKITEADLVGKWDCYEWFDSNGELFETPPHALIGFYADGFELGENNDFSIYYQGREESTASKVDGTWSIEDGKQLVFLYWGTKREELDIQTFEGTEMGIYHEREIAETIITNEYRLRKR